MPYRLQSCPRCLGTLALVEDVEYGQQWECLACGFIVYATTPLPFVREREGQSSRIYRRPR